jgi:murein DD-endopeptidase MepM/ murein hydrolase activator NlpD
MRRLFRSYLKKKTTFLFVPHDGEKPFHFKMPLYLFHVSVLTLGGLLAWAVTFVAKDVNYNRALFNEKRLRDRLQDINAELEANRTMLSQMSRMDSQFRKLLKLGDRKKVFELGVGGPTEEDSNRFSGLLQEKNDELMDKVQTTLKDTHQAVAQQEASFKEINLFLGKQRSILAAKPSIWPVKGWITSGFGLRVSPLSGERGRHMGVDIANETNTPIHATADGMVIYAGWEAGYGKAVVVEHGYGYSTRYGHCARIEASVGQEVKRGQVIGYLGSTGHSTGSHVHYEVRIHGVPVNPEKYLPQLD